MAVLALGLGKALRNFSPAHVAQGLPEAKDLTAEQKASLGQH